MNDPQNNLNQLLIRLESLVEKQSQLQKELLQLKSEIQSQKIIKPEENIPGNIEHPTKGDPNEKEDIAREESKYNDENETENTLEGVDVTYYSESQKGSFDDPKPEGDQFNQKYFPKDEKNKPKQKSNLEKFIGENLINKVGIAITVIGVGIGAKYSIENELINPLTRIILGYIMGIGFLGIAIWLKAKYENFSAVLLSGGMATLYLITFAAYSFYGLFPQAFTFILMVLFTAFTVIAALQYNKQVIAHFGLVGAYAVPFLLSDGSGKVVVLFTYMAIINSGILMIALRRYWKPLHTSAFFFTWIIFISWYVGMYEIQQHYGIALIFLTVFFFIFYISFLSYKVIRKEQFGTGDVVLLLLNSFLFYGLGYAILSDHIKGEHLLGMFTLLNAVLHFGVSALIYRKKLADKNLFYLLAGLVLVFITIAIPVQLDGNWVTLLWAGQAVLLFWIGRKSQVPLYEVLSYPLIILAFISILHDWSYQNSYSYMVPDSEEQIKVVFNIHFLSALIFIAAFSFLQFLSSQNHYTSRLKLRELFRPLFNLIIPTILLIVTYYALRIEIERFWDQKFIASAVENIADNDGYTNTYHDYTLTSFKNIWIINYSLVFLIILSWTNILKIKNRILDKVIYALNILAIVVFLGLGLYLFGELRDNFLNQYLAEFYHRDSAHLPLRYFSLVLFAVFMYSFYKMLQQSDMNTRLKATFDYILHISILWIASSELINWLELLGSSQSYKLGLSVLWGFYALLLIALGIWKKKKHLRVAAIGLFAMTLIKLFFYDIIHLDTIAKTIVFVSLGILLLIISFLYNKYKLKISDDV